MGYQAVTSTQSHPEGPARHDAPRLALAFAAVLAAPAAAQFAWTIQVDHSDPAGVVNSLDDTAQVTHWAAFDPDMYAFGGGDLDLSADDPLHAGVWSDLECLLKGPGHTEGTAVDGVIEDIYTWQLCFDRHAVPDESNPIKAWTGVWRTETLHPREVPLSTFSTEFFVYVYDYMCESDDFTDTLVEGNAVITVVPAPEVTVTGLLAFGLASRRRR